MMRKTYLYFFWGILISLGACRDDESYKQNQPDQSSNIELLLTSRVGSVVGDSLVKYVDALNLLLFRQNNNGEYVLFRQKVLAKDELRALADGDKSTEAGFTVFKEISFDTIPVGYYQIVGVGNALDSIGNALPEVSLQGATVGASMNNVLAQIKDSDQSPRLFWGKTETIQAGGSTNELPVLRLYRKVSMFSLTLLKIPDVVDKITMEFQNTYGSFNMEGNYPPSSIFVYASNEYQQTVQDSITLNYITLPTVEGDSTSIIATFYLTGSSKQVSNLPKYVFAPNTITKVTATIDPDQAGSTWKVDLNSLITVNVEWNVDQEPPIVI